MNYSVIHAFDKNLGKFCVLQFPLYSSDATVHVIILKNNRLVQVFLNFVCMVLMYLIELQQF